MPQGWRKLFQVFKKGGGEKRWFKDLSRGLLVMEGAAWDGGFGRDVLGVMDLGAQRCPSLPTRPQLRGMRGEGKPAEDAERGGGFDDLCAGRCLP